MFENELGGLGPAQVPSLCVGSKPFDYGGAAGMRCQFSIPRITFSANNVPRAFHAHSKLPKEEQSRKRRPIKAKGNRVLFEP
jgi:hypothetical protein